MKKIEFGDVIYYVGQNSKENDELFKTMPNNSMWFHLESKSSCHVYCVSSSSGPRKLTKEEIKKGSELVKFWSKKTDKVIYTTKNKLKRIGPGLVEILST